LAYRSPNESDLLISLIVDGEPSEAHDAAFSRARARSARRVAPERWRSAEEVLAKELPEDLLAQASTVEETDRLQQDRDRVLEEDQQLRAAVDRASDDELAELRERLAETEQRERALRDALENISVRQVPVYEHREYLDRALSEARERILIISPWIRYEVVDNQLLGRLRKLLDRGVELWIGYGIARRGGYRPGKKGEADRAAENELRRISEQYRNFHLARLGDTHAKVLVCDSRFSIVTSFNWLSFRGDAQLEFRDERGYYVGLAEKVNELFESYRLRFDEPAS
jgi:phosphatidylserine/phosphatidylglycerophosphate/cardiolipin synthase-like enzyme